jgi:hypothetical protein
VWRGERCGGVRGVDWAVRSGGRERYSGRRARACSASSSLVHSIHIHKYINYKDADFVISYNVRKL